MRKPLDKRTLMLHEQVTLLFNGIPNSVMANVFGSLVALFVYRGAVDGTRLYSWIALLLAITLARWLHYRRFRLVRPEPRDIARWYQQFRIGAIMLAAAVGSAGFLLFVYDSEPFQMTLALMMVCIASFAVNSMAPRPELAVAFLLLILSPLTGSLYLTGTGTGIAAFWMMLVLILMLSISTLRIGRTLARSIELSIDADSRERDLFEFQQRLSLYVKKTPLAVVEWDQNLNVKEWNPAAEQVFGYRREEAEGRKLSDLLFPGMSADRLADVWHTLEDGSGGHRLVVENRRQDGTLITCEWFNTLLADTQSFNRGVMSLVQDVTQRMANERLKQEFVSIVSHELRTPVTSIKGSLGLLTSGVLDTEPETRRELMSIALANTNRLQLLINDILDVDRLESGKMEFRFRDTDLVALARDAVAVNQTYAQQYGVRMVCENLPETCTVKIDPDRVMQVVTNMMSNAIKFSEANGTVTLRIEVSGHDAKLSVHNRGEVIPEADRALLFGKFFQRDASSTRAKGGSGLGLYISQRILEEHDSLMDYESTSEKGTTFFFVLHTVSP
ncbi:MAG: sensor histidine kinase [Gammaproteobacteria bacterium]